MTYGGSYMAAMPLNTMDTSERYVVSELSGSDSELHNLSSMGLEKGSELSICYKQEGSMLVKIQDSLYAITNRLAQTIIVSSCR